MTRFFDGSLEANTKVTLFRNESVNETTETYIYLQDLNDDGEIFFNVDYETNIQTVLLKKVMEWKIWI